MDKLGEMLVFLIRHAHSDPGDPDALRSLSERGFDEAEALAERLAAHPTPPRVVFSSPLLRARQTAESIATATGAVVRQDDRLAPSATAELMLATIGEADGPVAVVGHQPDCSEIAVALTGNDPGFTTAGVTEITLES